MGNFTRNFLSGRMNKVVDQRLLPESEYVDAMNVRMGSTEKSEVGVITNSKGNLPLTSLAYIDGTPLSTSARCIGAIEDSANETIYWFVHDSAFTVGATGKLDLIVSYNVLTNVLTYHVISIDNGGGIDTTLNFNESYLITGVNLIEDLIFFTDDYNPPRYININPSTNRYPNPVSNIDGGGITPLPNGVIPQQVFQESLLVIKKPPIESPSVTPIITSGQENFLETRFICFAYRYKYVDGEYSATSQWSEPAFIPKPFEFSINSMLNEGMVNSCNTAIVEYNSGGPLVVGIDLLFKESNKNIIKIIEKLDKADLGIGNNQVQQYSFNNSKIFTVLNEAEILRLYDSVPLLAKAQTIMGNRLMYGNYLEGWDLIDKYGIPTKFEYTTSLISEAIGLSSIPDNTESGNYSLNGTVSIPNSVLYVELVDKPLIEGSSLTIEFTIVHNEFTGSTPFPAETTQNINFTFSFLLTTTYSSVYQLASSSEFQLAIGTVTSIKPVYSGVPGAETSCDGTSLTDQFNCVLPQNLDTLQKYASGITAINQPIKIITTPASTKIGFQFPSMRYVDNTTTPTINVYEYYSVVFAQALFQKIANPSSLHSNRGYEIGIVYMDEFNRSTTALVSQFNTEHIPCGYSVYKNSIQVQIPPEQIAPAFAKRYKFVIKPDEEDYDVIYSNLFFTDPETNEVWFYLEGENQKKVEVGDRYIVKADTAGVVLNCAYATVLEKTAQPSEFIVPIEGVIVPAGVYMKINPSTFNAVATPNAVVAPGSLQACASPGGNYTVLPYPMNLVDPDNPGMYIDYTVPAGSRIKMNLFWERLGTSSTGSCEGRGYVLEKNYVSNSSYDNMEDWFRGSNVAATLNSGTSLDGDTKLEFLLPNAILVNENFDINYLQFYRDPTTNRLILQFSTGQSCTGVGSPNSRQYCVTVDIQVFRAESTIIFETQPKDSSPDLWYENDLSFAIDENGLHTGNVQNQSTTNSAIIDTGFYNCFAFGNGAESYKIRDSIIGKSFNLGERVTTVAAQDYKAAHRFSDITYSGVYNGESNINKLNEFNAGLSNFKHCEASFGAIQLLDGRNTDVLTLQEDKISYVLAEKNLLSDASAGGIITASPEVLGTQIARTEKYGISFNPESYVQWGFDRFFTDAKRGAVIQLKGGDSQNEQLIAISEQSMRTWFRDEFNASFNFQKLGGFDPYMNEYVLSMNDRELPINPQCLPCGTSQTFTLSIGSETSKTQTYCVDLGPSVGFANIIWAFTSIQSGKTLNVSATYDGTTVSSGPISADGQITFNKNNILVETVQITLTYTGDMVVSVIGDCCNAQQLNVVEVVLTNNSEAGRTIHTEYRYTNGAFVGPLLSTLVPFISSTSSPVVSRYNITTGPVGTGGFPPDLSNMRLLSNAIVPDDFIFNPTYNKFRYRRSNTLYPNTNLGIQTLISGSTLVTPILGAAPTYYGDFVVPSGGSYLYLIWDLRSAIETELCFGNSRVNSCCNCTSGTYYLDAAFNVATSVWSNNSLSTFAANGFYSLEGIVRELVDGVLLPQQTCAPCAVEVSLCFGTTVEDVCCNCTETCTTAYNLYSLTNPNAFSITVYSYDENGFLLSTVATPGGPYAICSIGAPYSDETIILVYEGCECLI
jgi:hypothetical protein